MNLEASLHSLLSFAWTLTRPTNVNLLQQNIVFSYSEKIPVSFSWLFHYYSFFFFGYFTLLLIFTKTILLLLFYYMFFHENHFCFFMFRDVPKCSMLRVLSTPCLFRCKLWAEKVKNCLSQQSSSRRPATSWKIIWKELYFALLLHLCSPWRHDL